MTEVQNLHFGEAQTVNQLNPADSPPVGLEVREREVDLRLCHGCFVRK